VSIDFEAEGLLGGVEGEARAARLDLLEQLHAAGVSLDKLREGVEADRLALLPVEHVLRGEELFTMAEIAERTGLPLEFVLAQTEAIGLSRPDPDARIWGEDDLEAMEDLHRAREAGIPDDGLLEVARVIGESSTRIADAVRRLVGEAFLRPGDTERDLGLRFAEAARMLGPHLGHQVEHVLMLHLRESIRNDVIGRAQLVSGELPGAQEVAVCFADLVGFTQLGEELPPEALTAVAGRLRELGSEVACAPVRLVKTIGDAVMLVSAEPAPLLDAALALVDRAEADESLPRLRSGLASGLALSRGGDWYGRPVNLASRVTAVARPSSVLVTGEVKEAAGEGYTYSNAGRRDLKGVSGAVRLFRARRAPVSDP